MNNISIWVINISAATILVTIIGFFINDKKAFRCIKSVLALYILLTAISPLSFKQSNEWEIPQNILESAPTVDTNLAIKQNAQTAIIKEINDVLSKGKCTAVVLSEDFAYAESVVLECEDKSDVDVLKKEIKEMLGEKIDVVVKVRREND